VRVERALRGLAQLAPPAELADRSGSSRFAAGVKISMSLLASRPSTPLASRPSMIAVRPSGKSTWVGYQRPSRMFGCRVHFSVSGSKVKTVFRPL
jgi:hypothetical protein